MAGRKALVHYFPAAKLGYREVLHTKHGAIGWSLSILLLVTIAVANRCLFYPSTCGM